VTVGAAGDGRRGDAASGGASKATAVWVFMCGSMPITIITVPFRRVQTEGSPDGHVLAAAYWPGSYQVT